MCFISFVGRSYQFIRRLLHNFTRVSRPRIDRNGTNSGEDDANHIVCVASSISLIMGACLGRQASSSDAGADHVNANSDTSTNHNTTTTTTVQPGRKRGIPSESRTLGSSQTSDRPKSTTMDGTATATTTTPGEAARRAAEERASKGGGRGGGKSGRQLLKEEALLARQRRDDAVLVYD